MAAFGINQGSASQQVAQRPGRAASYNQRGRIPQPTDPDFEEKLEQERQAIHLLRKQGYDDNSLMQFQNINGSVRGLLDERMFSPKKPETPQEKISRIDAERKLAEEEAGTRNLPKPEEWTDPITGEVKMRTTRPGGVIEEKPVLIDVPGPAGGVPLFKPMTRGGVTPEGKPWEQDYDKYGAPILNYDPEGKPIGTAGYREKPVKPQPVHEITDENGRLWNRVRVPDGQGGTTETFEEIKDKDGKPVFNTKEKRPYPIRDGYVIMKAKRTRTGELDEEGAEYELSDRAKNQARAIREQRKGAEADIERLEAEKREAPNQSNLKMQLELDEKIKASKKVVDSMKARRKQLEKDVGKWADQLPDPNLDEATPEQPAAPVSVAPVVPQAAPTAPLPTGQFRIVLTPDGRRKRVPADRLNEALKMGGTVVE